MATISEWNSVKTITQIEGSGTPFNVFDDIFSVTGEANGAVKRESVFYQWGARTVANNPLIKKFVCRWIVKGKIAISQAEFRCGCA